MKNLFKEYFYPIEKDLDEVWQDSLIVFDTSVLLNLYKYTEDTREQFLDLLCNNKERLWVPYQVAYEFFKNREKTICDQEKAYDEIKNCLESKLNSICNDLNHHLKHVLINVRDYQKMIDNCFKDIIRLLNEAKEVHPQFKDGEDLILQTISSLYESNVGDDFDKDTLRNLYKNGAERYKLQIPPGYEDAKQKESLGERHLYGDLIVWKQIIHKAKESKNNIIFITDDRKGDWFIKKQNALPRKELYKEFMDETGQRILIYKVEMFLSYAKERLTTNIDEESINEVKNINYFYDVHLSSDGSLTDLSDQSNASDFFNSQRLFKNSYINSDESLQRLSDQLITSDFLSSQRSILDSYIKPDGSYKRLFDQPNISDFLSSQRSFQNSYINSEMTLKNIFEKPNANSLLSKLSELNSSNSVPSNKLNKIVNYANMTNLAKQRNSLSTKDNEIHQLLKPILEPHFNYKIQIKRKK